MPKFVTIGYGDRAGYDATDLAVRSAAHEHDARVRAEGALVGGPERRYRCETTTTPA